MSAGNQKNGEKSELAPISLRTFEERTRALSLSSQMVECVDLLQSPDVVVEELLRSLLEVRQEKVASPSLGLTKRAVPDKSAYFYESRELFVQGDGCSFTCLATELDFVEEKAGAPVALEEEGGPLGAIDYAAVTCESRPFPVLGFTQRSESESAYPLLLRGLAGMIELLLPRRFDLLDRDVYRGLLGPAPVFDIALVLWDDDDEPDGRTPLCEFSRDLAEILKATLAASPDFPPVLNDVVCLRMNNKRFDGRLRFVWRV